MRSIPERQYGRRAYGRQQRRNPAARALHVAESILLHEAEGRTPSYADYGIDPTSPYGQLVTALLEAKRQQEAKG